MLTYIKGDKCPVWGPLLRIKGDKCRAGPRTHQFYTSILYFGARKHRFTTSLSYFGAERLRLDKKHSGRGDPSKYIDEKNRGSGGTFWRWSAFVFLVRFALLGFRFARLTSLDSLGNFANLGLMHSPRGLRSSEVLSSSLPSLISIIQILQTNASIILN